MKFLILGCNGMAGHTISLYLKEQGHDVTGFDKRESRLVKCVVGDAMNTDKLLELIQLGQFDSIINCIGILNQFAEQNKALATYLNSYLPHFLADVTNGMDTQVIHMSTDCVFSGKRGAYTEDDHRDGESFYDRSKALGELEDDKNITLRNSIVGPDINPNGIGLLNWFLKNTLGEEEHCLNGFTRTMWTGQTTLQLAKTMEVAAKEKAHGLYNTVPDYFVSKYELLGLFNKYFRHESVKIIPVDGINTNKALNRTHFDFNYRIPDYDVMVKELADWTIKHKELYPHYGI